MTFCKNWKKWIAFTTLTIGCLIGRPLYTYATAGQQLEQAQRDKAKAENGLEKANDSIQDLQTDRASLQSYLDNLNEELQKANSKLLEIDEIIEKKQATYFGIAMSVKRICEVILRDEKSILPVTSAMYGEYGISDVALSMPAIVGKNGVETKVPIPLSEDELDRLQQSASMLRDVLDEVGM